MNTLPPSGNSLATDVKDLASLRESAKKNSPAALKETAQKFEAMFVNMVLKSMREATPQDGPFDSEQSKMFTSMLDQELSQAMAKRGVGLSDVLVRQLSNEKESPVQKKEVSAPTSSDLVIKKTDQDSLVVSDSISSYLKQNGHSSGADETQKKFKERVQKVAEKTSLETGIPSDFIVAHAALESGWGKREIKNIDGSSTHNIFGIKASSDWKGEVAEIVTTEYVGGVPKKTIAKFKSYGSDEEAFSDYAKLLKENKRYSEVVGAASIDQFAMGLKKAGYATDPLYGEKLKQIIRRT